eukprot:365615_1
MSTRTVVHLILILLSVQYKICFSARQRLKMDFNWLFHLGLNNLTATCTDSDFPINMTGQQCKGLKQATSAKSISDCRNACCADMNCATYQWCPQGSSKSSCEPAGSCWIGAINDISKNTGWQSMGRPTPAPPNGPATRNYNDNNWMKKNVPDDFVVNTGAFNPANDKSHGYLPKNISWYRKHFTLNKSMINTTIWIDFDG